MKQTMYWCTECQSLHLGAYVTQVETTKPLPLATRETWKGRLKRVVIGALCLAWLTGVGFAGEQRVGKDNCPCPGAPRPQAPPPKK